MTRLLNKSVLDRKKKMQIAIATVSKNLRLSPETTCTTTPPSEPPSSLIMLKIFSKTPSNTKIF